MITLRERLEEELRVTLARLRAIARLEEREPARPSLNGVFEETDRIQLDEVREMEAVTHARLTDRLNRLLAALRRIDTGEYGKCVECGGLIADARLRALPEVETCIACQEKIERRRPVPGEVELEREAA